jgi:hypothetical protein
MAIAVLNRKTIRGGAQASAAGQGAPAGPQSFLSYRRYRHAKLATLICVVATGIFWWDNPVGGRSGGTWVGWGLGGFSAALMLWLLWFGVRKRSYFSTSASLQSWLSAHVYLGLTLLVLVPLHSGFQFGWNFHNLAQVLVGLVILSGLVGILMYAQVPDRMTRNRRGQKIDTLFEQVADLDAECAGVALALPDFYAQAADLAIGETRIGGGWLRQFSGREPRCGTSIALRLIQDHRVELTQQQRVNVARVVELLGRKAALLERIRRDVRYKALMDIWLFFHIPLAVASLVAVAVHIVIVFYYR